MGQIETKVNPRLKVCLARINLELKNKISNRGTSRYGLLSHLRTDHLVPERPKSYFSKTDTSTIRTLVPVSLVSVIS